MQSNTEAIEVEIIEEVKAPVLSSFHSPIPVVDITKLLEQYKDIPNIDPESEEAATQYAYVKKGHIALSKARNAIDKRRKEIGAPAFEFHKAVIAAAKEVQSLINPTELLLKAQRDKYEGYKETLRMEAELAEEARKDGHRKRISDLSQLPLKHISSSSEDIALIIESVAIPNADTYEEFEDDAVAAYAVTMSQLESAFETKVKAENADKIEAENMARLEAEEAERLKIQEAERAKFEDEKEAFRQQQREADEKIRAQQEAINRENAEREAEELARQQEIDRVNREEEQAKYREEQNRLRLEAEELRLKEEAIAKEEQAKQIKANHKAMVKEALEDMHFVDNPTTENILEAIISGEVRHIFWGCDE